MLMLIIVGCEALILMHRKGHSGIGPTQTVAFKGPEGSYTPRQRREIFVEGSGEQFFFLI